MFHHVGLWWLIETKDHCDFSFDEHCPCCCTGGPCYNTTICQKLHRHTFEDFFVTVRQDRYELMHGLHEYYKLNDRSTDEKNFGGVITLPEYSTTDFLVSLSVILNFIDICKNS